MAAVPPTYTTETESAAALDDRLQTADLFNVYTEVPGTLIQPRPGQVDKGVRIDRILVPNNRLVGLGWRHGIIGVEIKRSDIAIGRPLAQAMDYTRSTFSLPDGGFQVVPTWVFVWPEDKQHGPLASLMAQNRVGVVSSTNWALLHFTAGEMSLLHVSRDGTVRLGNQSSGTKAGSR